MYNLPYLSQSEQDEYFELWLIVRNLTVATSFPDSDVAWLINRMKCLRNKNSTRAYMAIPENDQIQVLA